MLEHSRIVRMNFLLFFATLKSILMIALVGTAVSMVVQGCDDPPPDQPDDPAPPPPGDEKPGQPYPIRACVPYSIRVMYAHSGEVMFVLHRFCPKGITAFRPQRPRFLWIPGTGVSIIPTDPQAPCSCHRHELCHVHGRLR